MKLKYWLCKKCVKPIQVQIVRKSSFVETPMGYCNLCKTYYEVPSELYRQSNSALNKTYSQLSTPEKNNFNKTMKKLKKDANWDGHKELFIAMLLCERTVESNEKVAKLLGVEEKVK